MVQLSYQGKWNYLFLAIKSDYTLTIWKAAQEKVVYLKLYH